MLADVPPCAVPRVERNREYFNSGSSQRVGQSLPRWNRCEAKRASRVEDEEHLSSCGIGSLAYDYRAPVERNCSEGRDHGPAVRQGTALPEFLIFRGEPAIAALRPASTPASIPVLLGAS